MAKNARFSLRFQLISGVVLCLLLVESVFGYFSYHKKIDELNDLRGTAMALAMAGAKADLLLTDSEIRQRADRYALNMAMIVAAIIASISAIVYSLADRLVLRPLGLLIRANRDYGAGGTGRIDPALFPRNELGTLMAERQSMLTSLEGLMAGEALDALLASVEARDHYTGDHCRRVADLGAQLAREMGADADEVEDVRRAGQIHDVGKLGIPDRLLQKAGPLDAAEMEEIQAHPFRGFSIVQYNRRLSNRAKLGVLYHHERFDGKGYPNSLEGPAIPRVARILAVADAWDALTHDRPYRSGRGEDQAWDEIVANSGTQFDPEVVGAFARLRRGSGWAAGNRAA